MANISILVSSNCSKQSGSFVNASDVGCGEKKAKQEAESGIDDVQLKIEEEAFGSLTPVFFRRRSITLLRYRRGSDAVKIPHHDGKQHSSNAQLTSAMDDVFMILDASSFPSASTVIYNGIP